MLCFVGNRAYDAICGMRFPRCIAVGGAYMGSIWNDGVEVFKLYINEVKLLGLQDGFFFYLGTFGANVFGYGWYQFFQEPVKEYPVIKLDLTQATKWPPLMDVVDYVGRSVLEKRKQDLNSLVVSDRELEVL